LHSAQSRVALMQRLNRDPNSDLPAKAGNVADLTNMA